ncbi:hypothetical protein DGG96_07325 [Legionella qingyii]|uniref:Uncharacterized protein n=1 Tax=Legionella qingyii TaxID=2184757 RepID=A0A317U683_9GAMM|nr:hypothetical protein DGG96_07325 [Legionella qingyii]
MKDQKIQETVRNLKVTGRIIVAVIRKVNCSRKSEVETKEIRQIDKREPSRVIVQDVHEIRTFNYSTLLFRLRRQPRKVDDMKEIS